MKINLQYKNYLFQRYVKDFLHFYPYIILLAIIVSKAQLSINLGIAIVVNYFLMVISFLYNDIEDREDDANSPGKRFKNPFGYKIWPLWVGYLLVTVLSLATLVVSFAIGGMVLAAITLSNIVIGLLYSSQKLRLKAYPVVDLLSHAYLLAGAEIFYFMVLSNTLFDVRSLIVLASAFIISAAGDLKNEYRDFEEDREAKINNTANVIGKKNTLLVSKIFTYIGVSAIALTLVSYLYAYVVSRPF